MSRISERRIIRAHSVARKWLFNAASPEFRFRVFTKSAKSANIHVHHLRRFRDGDSDLSGISPIRDLGTKASGDSFYVWSRDRCGLRRLKDHYESQGLETSGIW